MLVGVAYYPAVLISLFAAVVRWRQLALAGVLGVSVVVTVLVETGRLPLWATFIVVCLGVLGLVGLGVSANSRYRAPGLVARPDLPAFVVPAGPGPVFTASAFTLLGILQVGDGVHDLVRSGDLWSYDLGLTVLWLLLVAAQWVPAWRRYGVRLEPDRLVSWQVIGSLSVPWTAFDPDQPALPGRNNELKLRFARPELVRRRGVHLPESIGLPVIDAGRLGRAVGEYVAHPEHRAAIGTEAELRRLDG